MKEAGLFQAIEKGEKAALSWMLCIISSWGFGKFDSDDLYRMFLL